MVGKDNSCPLTPWVYFLYPRAKGSCLTMKRGLTAWEEFWLAMSTEQEIKAEVEAPASVSIKKEGNIIEVKGTLGTIKKDFTKLPATVTVQGNKITIKPYGMRKRDLAVTNTARSIIAAMIKGVERGYTYKLKIIFAHFPISVKVKGKEVMLRTFLAKGRQGFLE